MWFFQIDVNSYRMSFKGGLLLFGYLWGLLFPGEELGR
jgi:hypothetical protein